MSQSPFRAHAPLRDRERGDLTVHLREITADNFVEAIRLKAKPEQEGLVASNAASIAQSKFHTFLECYGIYDGDEMVGFSACGVNPEDGTVWIVRHMVGAPFQGKGYGRQGLRCIIDHLRQLHPASPIFLDVAPSNERAIALYESEGFCDTGRIQGESRVYRLDLG
jgi:diamine N-acetyltransferase